MTSWLESIQEVIATIGNFLHTAADSIGQLGSTVSESFEFVKLTLGNLPGSIAAAALLVLAIAVIYLVIGR